MLAGIFRKPYLRRNDGGACRSETIADRLIDLREIGQTPAKGISNKNQMLFLNKTQAIFMQIWPGARHGLDVIGKVLRNPGISINISTLIIIKHPGISVRRGRFLWLRRRVSDGWLTRFLKGHPNRPSRPMFVEPHQKPLFRRIPIAPKIFCSAPVAHMR